MLFKAIRNCLLCGGLFLLPVLAFAANSRDCLNSIADAVENGDSAAFAELVDLDAILNQALDVFLQEVQKPENAPYLPPMITMMFSQAANQQQIRQLLLQESRAFVLNGVASGSFAGKQLSTAERQGFLAPLFAHASTGRKEIRDIGESVRDEAGWLIPFTIHDYGNGHDYAVIGRFAENGNAMRLAGIENLQQLFAQIRREAAGAE